MSVFKVEELRALAQMFLELNVQAGYIGIVFFGLFDILIGYLILRSTFLPRILGALMALAGLGWLTFLSPPLANSHYLSLPIDVLGFVAEASLMLWLVVKGVNGQRWKEQAGASGIPNPGTMQWQQESVLRRAGSSIFVGNRGQRPDQPRSAHLSGPWKDGASVTRRQRLGLAVIVGWCALVMLATVVTGRLYLGALLAIAFLLALPFRAR